MRSLRVSIALAVLIVAAVFAVSHSRAQVTQTHVTQPTWEYKVVDVVKMIDDARGRGEIGATFEKHLNFPGKDGWELCQEVNGAMIFTRKG